MSTWPVAVPTANTSGRETDHRTENKYPQSGSTERMGEDWNKHVQCNHVSYESCEHDAGMGRSNERMRFDNY